MRTEEVRLPEEGRNAYAFSRALMLLIRACHAANRRNAHKKELAAEPPGFWWAKLGEEREELYDAWMEENKTRFVEELGDVAMCLIGLLIQGGYSAKDMPPVRAQRTTKAKDWIGGTKAESELERRKE